MSFKVFVGPNGTLPTKATPQSAGWDIYSAADVTVAGTLIKIPTDIRVMLPRGTYGRLAPRSGLSAKYGLDVLAGIVDRDYRGEVIVILHNPYALNTPFVLKKGDRICQLVITKIDECDIQQVNSMDELSETTRGEKGFGSSGMTENDSKLYKLTKFEKNKVMESDEDDDQADVHFNIESVYCKLDIYKENISAAKETLTNIMIKADRVIVSQTKNPMPTDKVAYKREFVGKNCKLIVHADIPCTEQMSVLFTNLVQQADVAMGNDK
jgi:dUTP pyrophosphatase